ncbi:MAG: drm, partial [bacterium]
MSSICIKRIVLIILDSVGIGELPDALDYGDVGSNTLKNIAEELGGLNLPNLES